MKNQEIAKILAQIGIYLEMDNIPFKPQAYQKAALSLETLTDDVEDIYKREGIEGLKAIPGIGENIAHKIIEYLKTGTIKEYEQYRKKIPVHLDELLEVEGLGPKTIKALYQNLQITNLLELEKAALEGKIRKLKGFGEKTEKNILESIAFLKRSQGRFLLSEALFLAEEIINKLRHLKEIDKIVYAGSLRRMKETIGDIDLLVTLKKANQVNAKKIMDVFTHLEGIIKIWDAGITKSSVRFQNNLDVDLRVVQKEEFGSALQYFTGSKEHNIKLRELALTKGWKLNEYGLFEQNKNTNLKINLKIKSNSLQGKKQALTSTEKRIAGTTEEEIYQVLGLPYIEPELRENTGEIEAAMANALPKLINYDEIRGDLHCHSNWDGGENSLEEMAKAAQVLGYEYLGISDHTKFLRIENGLDEKQLLAQHEAIQKLNLKFKIENLKFRLLHGCEANILNDGSLDIDDKVLAQLDYVIAGIHSNMKMTKEEMTKRIIKAMENPYVKIISHPTGRLINQRDEYLIDFEQILKVAKATNTALEINASPFRLDLKDSNIRKAIQNRVKLVINTDSHQKNQLLFMRLGIAQARRGWATKEDIINSWPLEKLLEFFQAKH